MSAVASQAERRVSLMAARPHTIELQPEAFDLVKREAERRGLSPDQLVEEIIRTDLAAIHRGDLRLHSVVRPIYARRCHASTA